MPIDLTRRYAKFRVARRFICEHPAVTAEFFSAMQFIPFRVDYLLEQDELFYTGCSPLFPECPPECYASEVLVVGRREGEDRDIFLAQCFRGAMKRIVVALPARESADVKESP